MQTIIEPQAHIPVHPLQDLFDLIEAEEEEKIGLSDLGSVQAVASMDQAERIVREIKKVRAEREAAVAHAQSQMDAAQAKVQSFLERAVTPLNNKEAYLTGLLEEYAKRTLDGSSKKSIKLVEGTLSISKQTPEFIYDDEALLGFLKAEMPEYVRTVYQPNKADLKKAGEVIDNSLVVNGKRVDGVVVTEKPDKFTIK